MRTVTYKGPGSNAVRVKGTRFEPGKPVEVTEALAEFVSGLNGYEFEVEQPPKQTEDKVSAKPAKSRPKATE